MTFISENNIANLYSAIIEMPIFDEYKLPPASKVDFVIVDDDSICGEYQPPEQGEPHVITISVAIHSHLYTVLITLCHEILHMAVYTVSQKTITAGDSDGRSSGCSFWRTTNRSRTCHQFRRKTADTTGMD